jgi:hypothetical protein
VLLNWRISNPQQIQNLIISQETNNSSPVKKTFLYCNPQNSNPQEMPAKPNKIEKIKGREFLVCQGVATNLTQPGDYTFKLEVFSKQNLTQPSDTKQTDTVTIQASPIPKFLTKFYLTNLTMNIKNPCS